MFVSPGGSTQAVGLFNDQEGAISSDKNDLQALNDALYSKSYLGLGAKVRHFYYIGYRIIQTSIVSLVKLMLQEDIDDTTRYLAVNLVSRVSPAPRSVSSFPP